ncbi:hypothetical protein GUJ93_ZPchr0001g32181 [Zizania palustris]|uniref:methionine adenosyltransferase n=1 Tax=Zizania palustris TaxID=103762 RepID=A0A8J5RN38_ZIZPA|nr:hypothetical protein GUJ93_ZPchr0001g32181 [Zizania palustris]
MVPIRVHTVLISTQHDETVTNDEIAADLKEHVIKPVVPEQYLDEKTDLPSQPFRSLCQRWTSWRCRSHRRKIIIDTYGGWGAHGGGAFSGKDPTKVDRSGAYVARQAAKSIVASKIPDKEILKIVTENFDFRPGMIIINLDLMRGGNGRYLKTAAYGHFGREDPDFTWEVVKPLKWENPSA